MTVSEAITIIQARGEMSGECRCKRSNKSYTPSRGCAICASTGVMHLCRTCKGCGINPLTANACAPCEGKGYDPLAALTRKSAATTKHSAEAAHGNR